MKATELIPDRANRNRHTNIGRLAVRESVQEDGYLRPILIDSHNRVIAGNEVVAVNPDAEVLIVDADADELVVHVREDIEYGTDQASRVGVRDNRTAEINRQWDRETLTEDYQRFDLSQYWKSDELESSPSDQWISVTVKVPDAVYQIWKSTMGKMPGDTDQAKLVAFMDMVEGVRNGASNRP